MRCLLSIDSGGTKCQTVAVSENGALVGWGRSGFSEREDPPRTQHPAMTDAHAAPGAAIPTGGSGRTVEAVSAAVWQALDGLDCTELHVVSYYRHRSLDNILSGRFKGEIVHHPVHEHEGVLELVGLRFGIIASSGTGAFVHVVGEDDSHLHLDSLGPILGDRGSAFHIGMRAIQAAARHDWHPRHRTTLNQVIHNALGIEMTRDRGASLIWVFERVKDRAIIADLARLVDEEARAGDAVARNVLDEAARSLSETVYDAYDSLNLKDQGYSLVGTGGVIEKSDIFWDSLRRYVHDFAPDLGFARTELPHVVGTALRALPTIANGDLDAARDRLIQTAREVFCQNSEGVSQ